MQYILQNLLAIAAATLAGLVVSGLYAGVGRRGTAGSRRGRVLLLALAVVTQGWLASILAGALILAPPQAGAWTMALGSAVVIWIGFVLPSVLLTLRWRAVRWGPALADCAAWLAVMATQAAVLHLIGLTKPG